MVFIVLHPLDDSFGWWTRLELEVPMVLLSPCPFLPVIPLDSCLLLEELAPHLELGVAPLLRRMVHLFLLFLRSHITYCHSSYCVHWNFIFIYIIKISLLTWRTISLIKYNIISDFNQTQRFVEDPICLRI
jgi:hypothetical protein